jgi:hypothetical protein
VPGLSLEGGDVKVEVFLPGVAKRGIFSHLKGESKEDKA